jgi:hypothetical protein
VAAGDEVPEVDRISRPVTIQQEYVYHTDLAAPTAARVVTGQLPTSAAPASHVMVVYHLLWFLLLLTFSRMVELRALTLISMNRQYYCLTAQAVT